MGEVPGCNSMPKSTTLCGVVQVTHMEKHPHNRTLPKVDPSMVSPHPLG